MSCFAAWTSLKVCLGFHPALTCSHKLTQGSLAPLYGVNIWLHIACHHSIHDVISGCNFANSSSWPLSKLYLETIVQLWAICLHTFLIFSLRCTERTLDFLFASFKKCHGQLTTCSLQ